jgi:hypothetical protein
MPDMGSEDVVGASGLAEGGGPDLLADSIPGGMDCMSVGLFWAEASIGSTDSVAMSNIK